MTCLFLHEVPAGIEICEDHYRRGWMCHRSWKCISRAACIACKDRHEAEGVRDLKQHPRAAPNTAYPTEGERALRLRNLPPTRRILK